MIFMYNSLNEIIGVQYEGYNYYYLKNAMGDVIGFIDELENHLTIYYYNAWGNHTSGSTINFSSAENSSLSHKLDEINPMRYRGYYLDSELNFFYLQSRYYASDWCRFINADLPEYAQMQKDDNAGTNLFAYCCNDPVNNIDPTGYIIQKIDAAIAIVMFVVYYIAEKVLKLNSKYKIECKNILVDSIDNYIVKIVYYKSIFNKKSFVLSLGDKKSWGKATNINEHLNMELVNNQADYMQSEYNKGPTGSLTGEGPDNLGIVFASSTVAVYLVAQNIKVSNIKNYYNKVWGKNRVLKGNPSIYYLFNITKGDKNLNGWYAYNYTNGGVKKL